MSINQIHSTNDYIYAATSSGLYIYNPLTDALCAYAEYEDGITSVAGNTDYIFLGTTNSGIKYISTSVIECNQNNPTNLTSYLRTFNIPNITNNKIRYLHISNENYMGICTYSGVDYYHFNTNPNIHSVTYISGAEKCFVLPDYIYYTVSGYLNETEYSLCMNYLCLCDWTTPTKTYTTSSGMFEQNIQLTDLYVTYQTGKDNNNTIFCSTTSGIYVIDEGSQKYAIYYTET